MSLHAPTSDYDVAFYEFVVGQVRSVLGEATGVGANRFFLAGVFNLELGVLREEEACMGFYGPFRWRCRKADLVSYGTILMCMDTLPMTLPRARRQ